jgi:hypothetical protein
VDEVLAISIFAAGIDASIETIRFLGGFLLLDFVLYLALKHRQHLGGINEQILLLQEDGVEFIDGRVDLEKYLWDGKTQS